MPDVKEAFHIGAKGFLMC